MKKVITLEQVNRYNQMIELAKGTEAYNRLALRQEWITDDRRWLIKPYLQTISTYDADDEFYIKTYKGRTYLCCNLEGTIVDKYRLDCCEIAKAFFGA